MLVLAKVLLSATCSLVVLLALAPVASAHEGEENVPAITDVQEAIAIIAEHPGVFPLPEVVDHAMDKVGDAQESSDTRGVDLGLVKQAETALQAGDMKHAEVLLEQSIGACPGTAVIDPDTAPRTPPPLASPCPSPPAHLLALSRSHVTGTEEPVLLAIGGLLIVIGLALVRRVR